MNENASPRRYDRTDPTGRRYMAAVLGEPVPTAYPHTDPRGQSARTLTAADLARPVSAAYRSPVVTRSHRHHSEVK